MTAPLTVFPTGTVEGRALANLVADIGSDQGYEVAVEGGATQSEVEAAAYGPGVVVFDATVEPGHDENYRRALLMLQFIPFTLVVSRSYLPTNFRPLVRHCTPPYPNSQTNEDIAAWLEDELRRLREKVPRPPQLQGRESASRLIDEGQADTVSQRRSEASIFVSYRGAHETAVAELARATHVRPEQHVRYLATGELAPPDELMSAQDRWAILRIIVDWLASCRDVWVFWTPDYLGSWWTRSEVMLIAGQERRVRPRVFLWDEETRRQRRLWGVWLARVGPEDREAITERLIIGRNPEWLSRADRDTAGLAGLARHGSSATAAKSYRDDLVFSCTTCAQESGASAPGSIRRFGDLLRFRVRDVIELASPDLTVFDREMVAQVAAANGTLACPRCGSSFRPRRGPPRYWFYPVRWLEERQPTVEETDDWRALRLGDSHIVERATGPGGVVLEERPVYLLEPAR